MLSTVKAKPNYYELLGLSPKASNSEIAQAFAREAGMFRPRAFGAAAEVCLAYAILNDPAKRRAYDDSIGLTAEPEASRPALTEIKIGYRQEWAAAPFVPARSPVAASDGAQSTPPLSPIAAADNAQPTVPLQPVSPAETAYRASDASMSIREQVEQVLAQRGSAFAGTTESVELAKPGLIIGALLLAAAVAGVYVGLSSAEAVEPEPAVPAAPVGGSIAKPEPASAVEAPRAQNVRSAVDPEPKAAMANRTGPSRREAPAEEPPAIPVESITESIQVVRVPAADTPSEDRATQQAAVAALPISNTAIARTIERIGYACGSVDSTAPVDAAGAGIFKVSCTSGDSYRAAPIRGRYHFRRWDQR